MNIKNCADGYAATSKYQDSGPVRSPNKLENNGKSALWFRLTVNAAYCYSQMGRYIYRYRKAGYCKSAGGVRIWRRVQSALIERKSDFPLINKANDAALFVENSPLLLWDTRVCVCGRKGRFSQDRSSLLMMKNESKMQCNATS